jgi:hypothetical protein
LAARMLVSKSIIAMEFFIGKRPRAGLTIR